MLVVQFPRRVKTHGCRRPTQLPPDAPAPVRAGGTRGSYSQQLVQGGEQGGMRIQLQLVVPPTL
jgi:hypothetical protein